MKGSYNIVLSDKIIEFTMTVQRKYTVILGASGTGKTKVANMVNIQKRSGVENKSDTTVKNILNEGDNWEYALKNNSGIVYIIDEHFKGLFRKDIAQILNKSDNYFVLISRRLISTLPYSYTDIYELQSRKSITKVISIYAERVYNGIGVDFNPAYVLTEGKGSDKAFFSHMCDCPVDGAESSSKVQDAIKELPHISGDVCVIVDGAAFGSFIKDVLYEIKQSSNNVILYLPESFEYLLLKAGALDPASEWLDRTYDFCDRSFFIEEFGEVSETDLITWERFYTELMVRLGERRNEEEKERTGVSTVAFSYQKGNLRGYFLSFTRRMKELLEELG